MPVYNSAKSNNPVYWVSLSIDNAGLDITGSNEEGSGSLTVIADIPEESLLAVSSQWEQRMSADAASLLGNIPVAGGVASSVLRTSGLNPIFQPATQQVWQGSSPLEFPISLIFDAKKDAKKEVYDPIIALTTYGMPSTKGSVVSPFGTILYAPGPNNINRDKYAVKLRVGRLYYIADGIMVSCNGSFATRFTKDGYPIAGRVDLVIRTSVVYTRSDWIKATARGSISETGRRPGV